MNEDGDRLRVLVVDDEWAARNYLVELLHASDLAEVTGAVASADEAEELLFGEGRSAFDAAFLDVRLSGRRDDGLELARSLSSVPGAPLVVLATAFDTHAIEAYDLGVTDYLRKPFTEARVEQCLHRLRSRRPKLEPKGPRRIAARRHKSLVFFACEEVWAFEAAERLTRVHTARGIFDVDLSLSAMEASFGRTFTRVHRNWLVNVAHIKGARTRHRHPPLGRRRHRRRPTRPPRPRRPRPRPTTPRHAPRHHHRPPPHDLTPPPRSRSAKGAKRWKEGGSATASPAWREEAELPPERTKRGSDGRREAPRRLRRRGGGKRSFLQKD